MACCSHTGREAASVPRASAKVLCPVVAVGVSGGSHQRRSARAEARGSRWHTGRRSKPLGQPARLHRTYAFTLIEVTLVVGMLVLISAFAIPRLTHLLAREQLPGSARQMRSLITMVRAHAAFDGKRYRVRFPEDQEKDPMGGDRQPIIEREDEPIEYPEEFTVVTEPWAVGATLLNDVWVAEVRRGRPTIEELQRLRQFRSEVQDALQREFEDLEHFEAERPPLEIYPDGTSEWVTFVLTQAPRGTSVEDLEGYERIELIIDGLTGLAWMQRPFYDEELDLFEEKGWPAVLRQDFLDPRVLTEDDVLELHEFRIREGGETRAETEEKGELPEEFELERSFDEELP